MASNLNRDLKLEIAHVLFIDIVAYSKCATDEQSELLEALNEAVRSSHCVEAAEENGTLTELPTGDGMALVFRDSPEAPAQAAIEISQKTQQASNLRLRMGIHSGPVNAVVDVSGRPNVAGAGINLAQRIMDCGDAGHILVSRRAAEDLAQHRKWQSLLHDIGEAEVKHGAKVHLLNFCGEDFGNAAVPAKLKRFGKVTSNKKWALVGLIIGVAAIALLVFYGVGTSIRGLSNKPASEGRPGGSFLPITDKSVAVLPFENLSDDKNNAYFIDGIQDEILTRLAKVADLKVISRTSTQRFKSKPGDLPSIAKQLGVAHILEGSAQRSADQVRVNVQLIKAATDAHLWAETYDRKLSDIFGVETEIASKIADVLRAKLTGPEHIAMAARPTENMEAHDFYLKGRYSAGKRFGDSLRRAIEYYNQALAKDPNYALAYAGIADSYALLPEYSNEPPDEAFSKGRLAAEKALSLDNNLAEAHTSLGLVLHAADLDLKGAKQEFERAIELNPNYAGAHYFLGLLVFAPLAQFDRAIAELKRAVELDPFSAIMNANLGYSYLLARHYPEAIDQLRKAEQVAPFVYTYGCLGMALGLNGDFPGAIAAYEKSYSVRADYHPPMLMAHLYGLHGDREKALQLFEQAKEIEQREGTTFAYGHALVSIGLGDKEQAIDWLERSYQARETGVIGYIKVDPLLDPLRGNPRFEALANKIIPSDAK